MTLDGQRTDVFAFAFNYRIDAGGDRFTDILSVVFLTERTPDLFDVSTHCRFDDAVYEILIDRLCPPQSYGLERHMHA